MCFDNTPNSFSLYSVTVFFFEFIIKERENDFRNFGTGGIRRSSVLIMCSLGDSITVHRRSTCENRLRTLEYRQKV